MNPHAQELRQLRSKVNEGKKKIAQIEREFMNLHSRGSVRSSKFSIMASEQTADPKVVSDKVSTRGPKEAYAELPVVSGVRKKPEGNFVKGKPPKMPAASEPLSSGTRDMPDPGTSDY